MSEATEIGMVAEYALRTGERLNAALKVYDAFDEIRRPIIKIFVSNLRDAVERECNGEGTDWSVDVHPSADWTSQRDNLLRVRRNGWQEGQYVGIGAAKYGPDALWFGVWGISDLGLAEQTRIHLGERVTDGGWVVPATHLPRQWCYNFENFFGRRRELGNWRSTAAIAAMYEHKDGEYHKRILDMIVNLARAADEILRVHSEA